MAFSKLSRLGLEEREYSYWPTGFPTPVCAKVVEREICACQPLRLTRGCWSKESIGELLIVFASCRREDEELQTYRFDDGACHWIMRTSSVHSQGAESVDGRGCPRRGLDGVLGVCHDDVAVGLMLRSGVRSTIRSVVSVAVRSSSAADVVARGEVDGQIFILALNSVL
jgi:hypothetical protein